MFLMLQLSTVLFISCAEVEGTNENEFSMDINGKIWKTDVVIQNIIHPTENGQTYDLYIGGQKDTEGFSIRIELDEHLLTSFIGRYPIYQSYSGSKGGQVHLLPSLHDFSYLNDYQLEGLKENNIIGYLTITEAEFKKSNNELWFTNLSGTFESSFKGEANDGTQTDITVSKGYFKILQLEKELQLTETEYDKVKIRLLGKDWTSDQHNFSIDLTDDQLFYSAVLTAERSAMDMDEENRGWVIRLYFDIPRSELGRSDDEFRHKFTLGPIPNSTGQIYFENGEAVDLGAKGILYLTADFKEVNGKVNWSYLNGSFDFSTKSYSENVTGVFSITNYID